MTEHGSLSLRALRRTRNLSAHALAVAVGVTEYTVYAWERKQCRPDPGSLRRLAEVLGVTPDVLDLAPNRRGHQFRRVAVSRATGAHSQHEAPVARHSQQAEEDSHVDPRC